MTMRERTRNDDGPAVHWFKDANASNDRCIDPYDTPTYTSGTYVEVSDNTVMHDVVTPGYERISGKGGIVNSPMDRTRTVLRDNLCSSSYVYSWAQKCSNSQEHGETPVWHTFRSAYVSELPSTDICSWDDLPALPSYSEQNLIDLAVTKAWSKIDLSEVQSLVMIGESKKTVASLVSIFSRFIKVVKAAKKADIRYLKKQMTYEELSNRYMELRYALRPLMYDIKGTTAALNKKASQQPLRCTFRAAETYSDAEDDTDTEGVVYHNQVGDWTYDIVKDTVAEVDVEVRAGVLCEIENLNNLHIWGTLQPIESVWELVPFSFIVDWFFNVGKTISSFTPNFGTKALASWYTVTKREYQYLGISHINCATEDDNTDNYVSVDYQRILKGCWIDKTVISKTRVPDPSRKILPTFNMNMDVFKLTDLLIIGHKLWGK